MFPLLPLLLLPQINIIMIMHQIHHDDPFCNLGTMHPARAAERDLGVRVDGVLGDVVCACGDELDEFDGGDLGGGFGEVGDGYEDVCAGEEV